MIKKLNNLFFYKILDTQQWELFNFINKPLHERWWKIKTNFNCNKTIQQLRATMRASFVWRHAPKRPILVNFDTRFRCNSGVSTFAGAHWSAKCTFSPLDTASLILLSGTLWPVPLRSRLDQWESVEENCIRSDVCHTPRTTTQFHPWWCGCDYGKLAGWWISFVKDNWKFYKQKNYLFYID